MMMGAPLDRTKLAKLCGMFGSDHDGERANAAAAAVRLVREAGLRWPDVLSPERPSSAPPRREREITNSAEAIEFVREHPEILTRWEATFIASIATQSFPLTSKQLHVLRKLVDKAHEAERGWS
jgi:hypothetical protein